jgi:beta-1,4-mannosyl-glycoprotein beta-1,4-N-acetylglucosaminyltransferase
MPRIFDCFTFFNENDVLEIRLEELYPVVDKFLIVESNVTFRGEYKGLNFDFDRFSKYFDKIIYDPCEYNPNIFSSAWEREIHQRNHISQIKNRLELDDIVIISDVDEIPRRSVIENIELNYHARLRLDKFSYGINMLTDEGNSAVRVVRAQALKDKTPQEIRKSEPSHIIDNAGWEFSSLGTAEEILYKLKSFSHSEFDTPQLTVEALKERMANGEDIVGRGMKHTIVDIDDTWPEAIKNNPEYWSKYKW